MLEVVQRLSARIFIKIQPKAPHSRPDIIYSGLDATASLLDVLLRLEYPPTSHHSFEFQLGSSHISDRFM